MKKLRILLALFTVFVFQGSFLRAMEPMAIESMFDDCRGDNACAAMQTDNMDADEPWICGKAVDCCKMIQELLLSITQDHFFYEKAVYCIENSQALISRLNAEIDISKSEYEIERLIEFRGQLQLSLLPLVSSVATYEMLIKQLDGMNLGDGHGR